MEETKLLIEKTIALNKLYDDGIKKLANKNNLPFDKMRDIIESDVDDVSLENKDLKTAIVKFIEEYDLSVINLVKEVSLNDIGINEVGVFAVYIEPLKVKELKKLRAKEIWDVVLFLKLLVQIQIGSELFSKEDKEFFHSFNDSIFLK